MTESAQNVVDAMPVQASYERIIAGIRNPDVRATLHDAEADERYVRRELEALEENAELSLEGKQHRADELIERYQPRLNEKYASAREKVTASAETSYLFSLPFPEGKTFGHAAARCKDTTEMLAVQAEADAIAARMGGKSITEMTKAVSKNPRDKGIQERSDSRMEALRKEFDRAMALGGIEGRIKALAVDKVAESLGIEDFDQIVGHHRTDVHYRALEDHRRATQQAFTLPSSKKIHNPFDPQRRRRRRHLFGRAHGRGTQHRRNAVPEAASEAIMEVIHG